MYITKLLHQENTNVFSREDFDESPEHVALTERLRKTLYYGRDPGSDRPSLPLTEIAVKYFRDAAPKELGKVDLYSAANVGRKAYASSCSLMVGMMYLKRLRHQSPEYLSQISSSDLFLISMLVASKYLYDEGTDEEVYNDEWADAADMETADINELEREFLQAINWNLYAGQQEFSEMLATIEATIARDKGCERGFYTYTDLMVLTERCNMINACLAILAELAKVVVVCSVAYVAGTLTLAASPRALTMAGSCLSVQPTSEVTIAETINTVDDDDLAEINETTDAFEACSSLANCENDLADIPLVSGVCDVGSPTELDKSRNNGLGFAGLVTLTLIKETIAQVIHGLQPNTQRHQARETHTTTTNARMRSPGTEVKCNCGACPLRGYEECYNVTRYTDGSFLSQNIADLTKAVWTEKCHCTDGERMHNDFTGYCRNGMSVDQVGCCCPVNGIPKPSCGHKFPDIALGFQTNSMVLVAG